VVTREIALSRHLVPSSWQFQNIESEIKRMLITKNLPLMLLCARFGCIGPELNHRQDKFLEMTFYHSPLPLFIWSQTDRMNFLSTAYYKLRSESNSVTKSI